MGDIPLQLSNSIVVLNTIVVSLLGRRWVMKILLRLILHSLELKPDLSSAIDVD